MIPNTQFRFMLPFYQRVNSEQTIIITESLFQPCLSKTVVGALVIYNKGNITRKHLQVRGEYLINIISDFP